MLRKAKTRGEQWDRDQRTSDREQPAGKANHRSKNYKENNCGFRGM